MKKKIIKSSNKQREKKSEIRWSPTLLPQLYTNKMRCVEGFLRRGQRKRQPAKYENGNVFLLVFLSLL